MIPKKIHYCWFGKNPLPELALKCINSWKIFCPDYEIIEWNESNFDINCCIYVKEAYEAKKWAFVSDYVRLFALVNNGGIYMDTDVELLKSLDVFLNHQAFSGFETEHSIPTGIMACEKENILFKELLADYDGKSFIMKNGLPDLTTNVVTITNYCLAKGLILNNEMQTVFGFTLYPKDYFCPKNYATGFIELTERTYTIHHFSGSWHSIEKIKQHNFGNRMRMKFGVNIGNFAEKIYGAFNKILSIIK